MAGKLIALLILLPLVGCTGSQDKAATAARSDGERSLASEYEIEALIRRETKREARDRLRRALAGLGSVRFRENECKADPGDVIQPVRGKPLMSLAAGGEIAEIFIPHRSTSANKDHLGGDLTNEKIKAVLLNSRVDEYDRLGRYHLAPGHSFSIRLKSGNQMDVQLYLGASIGSAIGPNGCSYWFEYPRERGGVMVWRPTLLSRTHPCPRS